MKMCRQMAMVRLQRWAPSTIGCHLHLRVIRAMSGYSSKLLRLQLLQKVAE
jgi:hypothetical protein